MELAGQARDFPKSEFVSDRMRIVLISHSEVIVDFNDQIKSVTRGYGSIDYEFKGYLPAKIAKLDILINDKVCDAFSCLVHKGARMKKVSLGDQTQDLIPAIVRS